MFTLEADFLPQADDGHLHCVLPVVCIQNMEFTGEHCLRRKMASLRRKNEDDLK
jgi:hypothetical protein